MLTDEKILITGVTGTVARPLAEFLAGNNEVWGLARFANDGGRQKEHYHSVAGEPVRILSDRQTLEAFGVTTRTVDLGDGDFSDLPDDFTYVLHLAWMRADLAHLEDALRTNVEGAGLLLHHCRNAKAALVMSGMGIYSPNTDPWHAYTETDPIGRGATAYAPTSPASKLGVEAVARYCARAYDLKITIARLNTLMGVSGSFPGMHISSVLTGGSMIAPYEPSPHTPIHMRDMQDQIESLLDAAGTPALITNWCGDETVTAQDWIAEASKLSGKPGHLEIRPAPGSPAGTCADPTRRQSITGKCRTDFWTEFRRLHEEIAL